MCTLIGIGHRQCHRAFLIPCSEAHRPALLRLALCRAHMLVESVLSTFNEYALAPGCASQGTASAGGPRPPPTSSSPAAWRAESAPSRAPSTPTASRCHATLPQSRLPLELPLSPTVSHRHVVLLTDRWTMLLYASWDASSGSAAFTSATGGVSWYTAWVQDRGAVAVHLWHMTSCCFEKHRLPMHLSTSPNAERSAMPCNRWRQGGAAEPEAGFLELGQCGACRGLGMGSCPAHVRQLAWRHMQPWRPCDRAQPQYDCPHSAHHQPPPVRLR